jgi:hypothetical protein
LIGHKVKFLQNLKTQIKDRIYTAVGELAWHAGCVMAEAFEKQGEQIALEEMERQDREEEGELILDIELPVAGAKGNGKAN